VNASGRVVEKSLFALDDHHYATQYLAPLTPQFPTTTVLMHEI
jgi:hypothetical protein